MPNDYIVLSKDCPVNLSISHYVPQINAVLCFAKYK